MQKGLKKLFTALFSLIILVSIVCISFISILEDITPKMWKGIISLTVKKENNVHKIDSNSYMLKYNNDLMLELRHMGWSVIDEYVLLKDLALAKNDDGTYSKIKTTQVLGGDFLLAEIEK
jgi:hypothetical protein